MMVRLKRVGLVLLLGATLSAQEPAKAPALTDLQKLQVTAVMQKVQIAQLHQVLAEQEFQQAQAAAQQTLQGLMVKGYQLNLETLSYVAEAPTKAPVSEKPK